MSRGASPFPATPPGVTPAVSRPDTAGPAPDPFGRDGPKRVARAPNPNLTRRPLSPPDRRLASELKHHGREGSLSGYTPPAHQRQGGFTPSSLAALPSSERSAAEMAARKKGRWVHHPTSELWRLRARSAGCP